MKNPDELNEYYIYTQKNKYPNKEIQLKNSRSIEDTLNPKAITIAVYISRLTSLQVFNAIIISTAMVLQSIAIGTSDWFVLNVNEYIPTAKGGLWNYCYISSTSFNGIAGDYSCLKYEELPNFAVFVNSRLYDSRILLICSLGFCGLLFFIEIFGILCLCMAEKKVDMFDSFVASRSTRFRMTNNSQGLTNVAHARSSPQIKTKTIDSTKVVGAIQMDGQETDETTNSARFTTSIIVNANMNEKTYDNSDIIAFNEYHTTKPTGYFAYLAIALITLVGSVMDFVLKVSGFALYDSYIQNLLKFNTVFLAYRSYSYWMMIVSICLILFFWLFKVFSTRYVINLTKNLIKQREDTLIANQENISSPYNNPPQTVIQYDPFKTSKLIRLNYRSILSK